MKKILVSVLCCALLMGGLTACGQKLAEAPESKTTETVESTAQEEVLYVVELTSFNDSKVAVIKAYRELTGLGLKEAKDTVDLAPCVILETTDEEMANQYKTALEEAGATVTISNGTASETESTTSSEAPSETTETATTGIETVTTGGSFTVDSIFYITDAGTVLTGTVNQGSIKMGDSVVIILENGTEIPATINRIEVFGEFLEEAETGKNVGLGFEEDIAKETVLTAVSVDVVTE